jgi:hypothetical protein
MEKVGKRCSEMQVGGKRKNQQKGLSNICQICFTCKVELLQHPKYLISLGTNNLASIDMMLIERLLSNLFIN